MAIWHMGLFFVTNFLAHAITVPASPRINEYLPIVKARIPWPPIIALFLPFYGLLRSLRRIFLTSHKDEVHAALMQRAVLVVARTERWSPLVGREELLYVQLSSDFNAIERSAFKP
ncbi:hypothetical protein AcV7_008337 [Taiwanofungus camphoratus]|nr:hypothetical protein AcV7_008337 [Antrodia cinnamomea]